MNLILQCTTGYQCSGIHVGYATSFVRVRADVSLYVKEDECIQASGLVHAVSD